MTVQFLGSTILYEWYTKKKPLVADETLSMKTYLQGNERFNYFSNYTSIQTKNTTFLINGDSKTIHIAKVSNSKPQELFSVSDLNTLLTQPQVKATLLPAKKGKTALGLSFAISDAKYRNIEVWYDPSSHRIVEIVLLFNKWNEAIGELVSGDTLKIKYTKWQALPANQKKNLSDYVIPNGTKWIPGSAFKNFKIVQ